MASLHLYQWVGLVPIVVLVAINKCSHRGPFLFSMRPCCSKP
ncbi:MAG: hypothetical protein ACLRWP_19800 [Bilophila wadsworthia]